MTWRNPPRAETDPPTKSMSRGTSRTAWSKLGHALLHLHRSTSRAGWNTSNRNRSCLCCVLGSWCKSTLRLGLLRTPRPSQGGHLFEQFLQFDARKAFHHGRKLADDLSHIAD